LIGSIVKFFRRRCERFNMSIIDDLKAEAAKLLAEAEAVEKKAEAAIESAVVKPVEAVVADVKKEVEPAPTPKAAPAAKPAGGKTVCGVKYAADGLTIEWKEK
jgi:hypothetical protein